MSEIPIPSQSPLFHAMNQERYTRQDKIKEIEKATGRTLIVYVANAAHPAGGLVSEDLIPFVDLLDKKTGIDLDLMIHSPGGDIDAAEKMLMICRSRSKTFRVIVPNSAKSAATLIALGADKIIMGDTSELGPIDPQIAIRRADGSLQWHPAQSFLDGLEMIKESLKQEGELFPAYLPLLEQLNPAMLDECVKSKERSRTLAADWLKKYMLKDRPEVAETVAEDLADARKHLSHGRAIDYQAVIDLGLSAELLTPDLQLWSAIWRLYCDYEFAIRRERLVKVFESNAVSIPVSIA